MNTIKFKLGGGSDPGCVRTNNEDNFVANADLSQNEWYLPLDQNKELTLGTKGCLLVVADGMGGMNAGEVASDIAVKVVEECFAPERITPDVLQDESSIAAFMKEAIVTADKRIKERSREDKSTEGMGTTIVMAWLSGDKVYVSWCGDSRAYCFHPDSGLRQLSKDHSYVQELIDGGKLDPQYAFDHPDSNIITRSLGDPRQTARPDFIAAPLYEGEIILLCSDGLSGMIRDEQTEEILYRNGEDMVRCKEALIECARKAGGHDNITVMMCRIITGGIKGPISVSGKSEKNNGITGEEKKIFFLKSAVGQAGMVKLSILVGILLVLAAVTGWYFGKKSGRNPGDTEPVRQVEQIPSVSSEPLKGISEPDNSTSDPTVINSEVPVVGTDDSPLSIGSGINRRTGIRSDRQTGNDNGKAPESAEEDKNKPSEVQTDENPGSIPEDLTPVTEAEAPKEAAQEVLTSVVSDKAKTEGESPAQKGGESVQKEEGDNPSVVRKSVESPDKHAVKEEKDSNSLENK